MYMTAEAIELFEAAAKNGDAYSMLRLGKSASDVCSILNTCDSSKEYSHKWLRQALSAIKPGADKGDPESLYLMYRLTRDLEDLEQSAMQEYGFSQYKLALFIKEGLYGKFKDDESRQRRVEELMQASSENGYPKAMLKYGDALLSEGKQSLAHQWYEKSAATGYVEALYEVGSYLSHEPEENGFGLDLVRGYGMLSLVATMDGGGGLGEYAIDKMSKVKNKMTANQIKAAKKYAAE